MSGSHSVATQGLPGDGLPGENSTIAPQSGTVKRAATLPVHNGKGSTEQLLSALAEKSAQANHGGS